MSDNLPAKIKNPNGDFTLSDLDKIKDFKEKGMPGLHTLDVDHVERAMALYLGGKSYRQICNILKVPKTIILFLSDKFNWYELRWNYLDELKETMAPKIIESKLQSQEFLLHLSLAYRKRIGTNIDRFLRTDDAKHFDEIDGKDVTNLLKIEEMLHKLSSENYSPGQGDKSLIALNGMGEGMTITKTSNNSVEITPKNTFASKLKQFADLKRAQEEADKPIPKEAHDIKSEVVNPNPEKKDEKTPV